MLHVDCSPARVCHASHKHTFPLHPPSPKKKSLPLFEFLPPPLLKIKTRGLSIHRFSTGIVTLSPPPPPERKDLFDLVANSTGLVCSRPSRVMCTLIHTLPQSPLSLVSLSTY
eukprot:Hpha_TRINITY_DN16487_c0_g1::TRINITY_DN16487_c0_g1_i2::g.163295::m.163295